MRRCLPGVLPALLVVLFSVSVPAKEWRLEKFGCLLSVGVAPENIRQTALVLNIVEIERGDKKILGQYAGQMVEGMNKAGARDVSREETTLSRLKAYEVSGTKNVDGRPVAAATRVAVFGRYMYILTVSSSSGTIAGDEQLQRAIEGFAAAAEGQGRFDIKKYWIHVAALLGAIFLGLWLRTRVKRSD